MDIRRNDTDIEHEAEMVPQDPKSPSVSAGPSDAVMTNSKQTKGSRVSKSCHTCTVDKRKACRTLLTIELANIGLKCVRSRGIGVKCDRCESLNYDCSEAPQISSSGGRQRRKLSYDKCSYCRRDRKKVGLSDT